jgi:hypothetical protein
MTGVVGSSLARRLPALALVGLFTAPAAVPSGDPEAAAKRFLGSIHFQ